MCHTTVSDTKNQKSKWNSVAHKPAGSPHLRASQDLLPGAPTKKGASYQSYLERPTNPTARGRGVHTYIPRLQDHRKLKLKRGAPKMGTQPLRPLQITASASKGAQTRSGRTYPYILPSCLPSVLPSFLPSVLSSFFPSFLPSFGPYLPSLLLLLRPTKYRFPIRKSTIS